MSDDPSGAQQFKILTDLFRISSSYIGQAVHVKPKPKEAIPIPPLLSGVDTVYLTFSESGYDEKTIRVGRQ